jgi:hypothetical protein
MEKSFRIESRGSVPQLLQNYVFEGFLPSVFSPKGTEGETITF